jgi:hypothetical protein
VDMPDADSCRDGFFGRAYRSGLLPARARDVA